MSEIPPVSNEDSSQDSYNTSLTRLPKADIRVDITGEGSILHGITCDFLLDDLQISIFRFITQRFRIPSDLVTEFFDFGITDFESIWTVFGDLSGDNVLALMEQWFNLDHWDTPGVQEGLAQLLAFSRSLDFHKPADDAPPDIQDIQGKLKRYQRTQNLI